MSDLNDKCPWPHFVDTPICAYDRDAYDKYQTGEYQLPKRCICGATLVYDKPVAICLVEYGKMVGEMLLEMEYPLTFIRTDITAVEDLKEVEQEMEKYESLTPTESLDAQRVADAYNKHSGSQKGVAGEIEAQRWSEDVDHVRRSMELVMWGKEGETYEEMTERRREAMGEVSMVAAIKKFAETATEEDLEVVKEVAAECRRVLEKFLDTSMGCPIPKVECPTCKQEVHPPHIPKSMLRACLFCGEDHAYHECPEYPEQRAAAMREARESEEKMKEDLARDKEDK